VDWRVPGRESDVGGPRRPRTGRCGARQARGEGWGGWYLCIGRAGAVRAGLRAPHAKTGPRALRRSWRWAQARRAGCRARRRSWRWRATSTRGRAACARARALKQKIWVEGVSYELQEIYGIDSLNSRRRVRPAARPRAPCSAAISRQQAGRRAREEGRLGDCMQCGNPVSLQPKPCNAVVCRAALLRHQQSAASRRAQPPGCGAGGRVDACARKFSYRKLHFYRASWTRRCRRRS